jgi:hypothetical protein
VCVVSSQPYIWIISKYSNKKLSIRSSDKTSDDDRGESEKYDIQNAARNRVKELETCSFYNGIHDLF